MKKKTFKRLTHEQQAELKSLAALRDDAIDSSDAPELVDWSGAKRGLFYRRIKQDETGTLVRAIAPARRQVSQFSTFRPQPSPAGS